jgi:hypothetical protein
LYHEYHKKLKINILKILHRKVDRAEQQSTTITKMLLDARLERLSAFARYCCFSFLSGFDYRFRPYFSPETFLESHPCVSSAVVRHYETWRDAMRQFWTVFYDIRHILHYSGAMTGEITSYIIKP